LDTLIKKFLHFSDDSFEGSDGTKVAYYTLLLEDSGDTDGRKRTLEVNLVGDEEVKRLKLNNPEVVDGFRGKICRLTGNLYTTDKTVTVAGNSKVIQVEKFVVKNIEIK